MITMKYFIAFYKKLKIIKKYQFKQSLEVFSQSYVVKKHQVIQFLFPCILTFILVFSVKGEKNVILPTFTFPAPCISEICFKIKSNLNFYFHTSFWYLKRFYEGLKGLHKTLRGTTKKCKNKNLI